MLEPFSKTKAVISMPMMARLAVLLMATSTASAFVVPLPYTSLAKVARQPIPMMNRCNNEGFNSFRRWPSSSTVSLTSKAQAFFGQGGEVRLLASQIVVFFLSFASSFGCLIALQLTFDEMRQLKRLDIDMLDKVMDARPMADQRGEKVLLDVDREGHLEWITVV